MAEYKYVDLPSKKVDNGGTLIADAITVELNELLEQGWAVDHALESRISGKTAFVLRR